MGVETVYTKNRSERNGRNFELLIANSKKSIQNIKLTKENIFLN